MGAYPIGVVGESFQNEDGTSRQTEIERCVVGETVTLVRDPMNRYDSNCVKVVSARGVQIGNISRDDGWICERIDREGFLDARVLRVGAGTKGKLGVVICVRTNEEEAWLKDAPEHSTAGGGCFGNVLIGGLIAFAEMVPL